MEYEISYGGKTFNGKVFCGVFIAEADSIETAQECAFGMIQQIRQGNLDDESYWHKNLHRIQIDVKPKQP